MYVMRQERLQLFDITHTYLLERSEAAKMQTPEPETVHDTKDASIIELEDRLDKLWESYLDLLDHYTKAQDDLKKHMTAGFLSLAKAQSSAPLGRRYGQDWYDERMKSTRRVQVSSDASETNEDAITTGLQTLSVSLANDPTEVERKKDVEKTSAKDEEPQPKQQPSPPGTPEPEPKKQSTEDEETGEAEKPKPVNPLRWYGILVPPELRKAQSSFSMVLETPPNTEGSTAPDYAVSPITNAVNTARGLREVETELRKVRKSLKKAEKVRITVTH
jgi:outer membrane biosynthesis protein TonB